MKNQKEKEDIPQNFPNIQLLELPGQSNQIFLIKALLSTNL